MVRVEIGVLNRRYLAFQISAIKFAKCARSRDFFYAHRCELPVKSISQVGRVYRQSRTQSLQAFWSAGQRREDSGDIKKIQFF